MTVVGGLAPAVRHCPERENTVDNAMIADLYTGPPAKLRPAAHGAAL